jgi:hypothetical protein
MTRDKTHLVRKQITRLANANYKPSEITRMINTINPETNHVSFGVFY